MKAIIFSDIGKFELVDRRIPEIEKESDVKIKILAASICGSDLHMLANPPGIKATERIILGHECVAEVEKVGKDVCGFNPGDRVILDNNISCGVCKMCQMGKPNMCLNMNSMGSMSDGIFAEYAVVPEKALVKIKKHVPIKKAIIAEPLNCTLGGIKKLQVSPGSACVVLGGGPLGLCYAAMLKKVGAGKVIVSEMSELRSNKAYELGADVVVNPMKHSLKETVMENTDGIGADIVVDCVGSLLADCIEIVRPGGQILLFGMNRNATSSIHQIDITTKSLTVYGSYIGDYTLQTVADILDNNVIDLSALVTHEYKLEEFEDAIEKMRTQEAVKVIIYPNGKI